MKEPIKFDEVARVLRAAMGEPVSTWVREPENGVAKGPVEHVWTFEIDRELVWWHLEDEEGLR